MFKGNNKILMSEQIFWKWKGSERIRRRSSKTTEGLENKLRSVIGKERKKS
jgi:hypothetical protein